MTRSTNARLIITDGTMANTASMLVELHGANLQDWLPKSPNAANAIWSSTPYQDGKQLVSKSYDNIIDTFTLEIDSNSMDTTIKGLRKFIKLLENAITYWTEEYNTHKFWLEVRGECETEVRYAYVIDYSIPEIDNPFAPPFEPTPESTLDELALSIEHTIWTDSLTVGDNCVDLSTEGSVPYHGSGIFVPTQSSDDIVAVVSTHAVSTLSGYVRLAYDYDSGIRFRNVTVPQGATIISAYLRLRANLDADLDDANVIIYGELNATPAAFSTWADFDGRTKTNVLNAVQWTAIEHMTQGDYYNSPDISAVIQEIVDLGGWASGNNLAILIYDDGSTAAPAAERYTGSFDDATYGPPYLYITYEDEGTLVTVGEQGICGTANLASMAGWKSYGITHVFGYDGGAFTANQVNDALAEHDIIGATPNIGDYLYVGREEPNPTYPFPFNNVCFYLSLLGNDGGTNKWEYYNGAGWSTLSKIDYEPGGFAMNTTELGFHIVIWELPDDWAETTINGVYGLWVRYEVDNNGITSPKQIANKAIYSISWPEIIIDEESIKGDIHAILDYLLQVAGYHDKVVVALKSYERSNGGLFTPYIPLRGSVGGDSSLLPPGVRVETAFSAATETTDTTSIYGRNITWSPAIAATDQTMIDLYFNTKTYAGRYHVWLRSHITDATAGQFSFYLELYTPSGSFIGQTKATVNTDGYDEWIDLGMIAFPQEVVFEVGAATYETRISIFGNTTDAGDIILYDLVLIPMDEGVFEITHNGGNLTTGMNAPYKVVTSNPKPGSYAFMLASAGGLYFAPDWDETIEIHEMLSILGNSLIKPNEKYYLYYFPMCANYASGFKLMKQFLFPVVDKHQRYLFARGDE